MDNTHKNTREVRLENIHFCSSIVSLVNKDIPNRRIGHNTTHIIVSKTKEDVPMEDK